MISTRKTRTIVAFVLLGAVITLIYLFRQVLPTFILALFLAYILTPVVVWISSKRVFNYKIPKGMAVIGIYILMITSLSLGGTYFVINLSNEMRTLIQDIPTYGAQVNEHLVPKISATLNVITTYLPKPSSEPVAIDNEDHDPSNPPAPMSPSHEDSELAKLLYSTRFEVRQGKNGFEVTPRRISEEKPENEIHELNVPKLINDAMTDLVHNLQAILLNLLNLGQVILISVVNSLFQTMITLMIAAFLIIDHQLIMQFFRDLFPIRFSHGVENFLEKQNTGLHGVIRGQLIICIVNGTLTGIGLLILDIKFALTLSILATICSLIPIFGVVISSVPIVLMAITNSFWTGLFALCWILGIHFVEGNILNPKIIGKSAEIHPVLVILALMAGERTYGLFGALIAVPLFSILQNTFLFIRETIFEAERSKERQHSLSQDN